ncbi:putative transmembrane protein [Sesbania bispinosa]|nr:putative transmembrane protein [Sesbania bispinosa]
MAEAEEAAIAMDSNSISEQMVNNFKELAKTFGKFYEVLFAIIPVATLNMTHHIAMKALVFMIVLYFFISVLGEMLHFHIRSFLIPNMVILSLGSAVSVLALMMISATIAWIGLVLWLFIFALVGYYNRQEIYQMIPERIKNLIEGGMPTHNSE